MSTNDGRDRTAHLYVPGSLSGGSKKVPLIDGGRGPTGISGVDFPSPRAGIETLAAADGCARRSRTSVDGPVSTRTWKPCNHRTTIQFVTVDGANHGWMGGPRTPRPGAPEPFADYDSSASAWKFLTAHPRPR